MDDTAQALPAETPLHEQFDHAARAMREMRVVNQPRDEAGRFAGEQVSEPEEAPPLADAEPEGEEEYDEEGYEADAPEEDQAEAVEMPKSWSKDDADLWQSLAPSAQAKIAEREAQRDTAVNSKFQEVANARKEYEAKLAEANQSRDNWAKDYDLLVAELSLPKPDPRQFGLGTQHYNRDAYDMAVLEWEQGSERLQTLRQQRESIRAQQEREVAEQWNARKAEIEAEHAPRLLSLVPELTDPVQAEPTLRALVSYGIESGLDANLFSEANQPFITSAELTLLAKARKYDELSKGTAKPEPKRQPAIKPGVATPRSAQKSVQKNKAMARLQTENSIEAAVAAMRAARR